MAATKDQIIEMEKQVTDEFAESVYFKKLEFCCPCSCSNELAVIDPSLILLLDGVRQHFGKPVHVTSGFRCRKYNAKVGGSNGSRHQYGDAADIVVEDTPSSKVYAYIDKMYGDTLGLGLYKGHTHVDTREKKARWMRIA